MIRIAVLDDTINAQIETNKDEAQNLDLVYNNSNLELFLSEAVKLNPKVIVVDLKYLEKYDDPIAKMEEIMSLSKSELCIVLYQFAKKELIDKLETKNSKAIKKPVSLKSLKVPMLRIILKEMSDTRKKEDISLKYFRSNLAETEPDFQGNLSSYKMNIEYIISKLDSLKANISSSKNLEQSKEIYNELIMNTVKAKDIMTSTLEKI